MSQSLKGVMNNHLGNFTVAGLPTASSAPPAERGDVAFATNGRKNGEGASAGTGTLVYWDAVAWRRVSDDTTVAA